jgi:hypothetical protein
MTPMSAHQRLNEGVWKWQGTKDEPEVSSDARTCRGRCWRCQERCNAANVQATGTRHKLSGARTCMRSVLTMPGEMQLTRTPRSAHSQPSVWVIFTTADLLQLYAICFCGCGTSNVAMLAVLMILPRPASAQKLLANLKLNAAADQGVLHAHELLGGCGTCRMQHFNPVSKVDAHSEGMRPLATDPATLIRRTLLKHVAAFCLAAQENAARVDAEGHVPVLR